MKREQSSYKASLQFLQARRLEIGNFGNTSEGAMATLKQITQRITGGDHVGVVVALHNDGYLEKLLKIAQYQYQQKRSEEIERNLVIIFAYALDCFLKYRPIYKPILDFFRPRLEKQLNNRTYRDFGPENKRYQALAQILKRFEECNDETQQSFARGKSLNEFVSSQLAKEEPTSCFEECVLTWLRLQVEETHSRIVKGLEKQEAGFCCSLHFEEGGYRRQVETLTQNFSRELPPLPSRRILKEETEQRDTIKRQVVSYLNSSGGIHYIGIDHNSQKEARFLGVSLTEKERPEILAFVLNEIVMKVFPSQDENEEENEKQQEARLQKFRQDKVVEFNAKGTFWQEYDINRYVSVDFIPLFNKNTWFYSRTGEALNFVVRIKVKPGDQYEVYHFINEKDIPEAYFRENNREKKLSMIDYYNEVYRRLKDKANGRSSEAPKVHALCRLVIKPKENPK